MSTEPKVTHSDAQVWHLDPEQAMRLIAGLENAVEEMREGASDDYEEDA